MTLHLQKNNYQSILDAFIYSIRATISDSSCDIDLPLQTNEWNLRQHIYHLIDTPSAGLHTILKEALSNPKSKVEIIPDIDNLNEHRTGLSVPQIISDLEDYSASFQQVLNLYDDDKLDSVIIETNLPQRGITEDRSARTLLDRLFVRHWSEHLYDMTRKH